MPLNVDPCMHPRRTMRLQVTKPLNRKVVHTEFGVTSQTDPKFFLSGWNPERTQHLKGRKLELVPVEQVGLQWTFDGVVDETFTKSGIEQGLRVLVSTLPKKQVKREVVTARNRFTLPESRITIPTPDELTSQISSPPTILEWRGFDLSNEN